MASNLEKDVAFDKLHPGEGPKTRKEYKFCDAPCSSRSSSSSATSVADTAVLKGRRGNPDDTQTVQPLCAPPAKLRPRPEQPCAHSRKVRLQEDSEDASCNDDDRDAVGQVLRKGLSVATTDQFTRVSKVQALWTPRRYVVRQEMYNDILMRLRAPTPSVDAFACKASAKCSTWWGKGGAVESAWSQSWASSQVGVLWCNPAFQVYDLYDIVRKAAKDDAEMILVVPDWKEFDYYEMMWPMVQRYHYYPPASNLFDKKGCNDNQFDWGVWAVHLRGKPIQVNKTVLAVQEQKYQLNPSSRRRYRRKMLRSSKV